MATDKVFYWIGLLTPNGAVDVRGPYNTQQGRDKEYVQNSDFWASADVPSVRFETVGRKKADAYSYALELLEQTAAPQDGSASATPTIAPEIATRTPQRQIETQSYAPEISTESSIRQEVGSAEAIEKSMETPQEESLEDVASMFRGENVGASIGPEELEFGGNSSTGLFDQNIDSAIQAEVGAADDYEKQIFANF